MEGVGREREQYQIPPAYQMTSSTGQNIRCNSDESKRHTAILGREMLQHLLVWQVSV